VNRLGGFGKANKQHSQKIIKENDMEKTDNQLIVSQVCGKINDLTRRFCDLVSQNEDLDSTWEIVDFGNDAKEVFDLLEKIK
jgi:hypothetical protein